MDVNSLGLPDRRGACEDQVGGGVCRPASAQRCGLPEATSRKHGQNSQISTGWRQFHKTNPMKVLLFTRTWRIFRPGRWSQWPLGNRSVRRSENRGRIDIHTGTFLFELSSVSLASLST